MSSTKCKSGLVGNFTYNNAYKKREFTVVTERWWGHTSQGQQMERKSMGSESF